MTTCCFTSFTYSYLAKAVVLATTIKRHNPDWTVVALVTDKPPPGFNLKGALSIFDEVVLGQTLLGDRTEPWLFRHDVVEACTAVKGPMLKRLVRLGYDNVVYLDPDTAVFSPLDAIDALLERFDLVLTPHQIDPDERESAIMDNEVASLRHGIFNLGFLAVRSSAEGRRFADWWSDRLERFCYAEPDRGIFVDQKWCDFAPALFDRVHILRDPGYNVASWNLNKRAIAIGGNGEITVNARPLRFWHFTKLGPVGDMATMKYAQDNVEVYEIWSWYKRQVEACKFDVPNGWWHYGRFTDGSLIPKHVRELYRRRSDLQQSFAQPFEVGQGTYHEWLRVHGHLG
jgi:hypothetical protein